MWTPKGICVSCALNPVKEVLLKGINLNIKAGSMVTLLSNEYDNDYLLQFLGNRHFKEKILTSYSLFVNN